MCSFIHLFSWARNTLSSWSFHLFSEISNTTLTWNSHTKQRVALLLVLSMIVIVCVDLYLIYTSNWLKFEDLSCPWISILPTCSLATDISLTPHLRLYALYWMYWSSWKSVDYFLFISASFDVTRLWLLIESQVSLYIIPFAVFYHVNIYCFVFYKTICCLWSYNSSSQQTNKLVSLDSSRSRRSSFVGDNVVSGPIYELAEVAH